MSRTVLVTGGAGFVGSNFVHHIQKRYPDYRVIVLDALTYAGSTDNLPAEMRDIGNGQYRFWYGNICNAELVDSLVAEADVIAHFAAETHVTRSIYDNLQFFQTDVLGTHTLVNALLKTGSASKRFIHISTSEVYGNAVTPVMDEDHPLNPMSPYASAKCGADRLVYSYWATYKLPLVILRPFNQYGPSQHLEKVIPRFITSAILGEPMKVHGEGQAARDFIHVADTCRAIDLVMHATDEQVIGQVFNVASGQDRTILEIAENIADAMGLRRDVIEFTGDRPGQVVRHTGDSTRIRDTLSWEPEISWEQGLRDTIAWHRDHQEQWRKQVWMRAIPITLADGRVEYH